MGFQSKRKWGIPYVHRKIKHFEKGELKVIIYNLSWFKAFGWTEDLWIFLLVIISRVTWSWKNQDTIWAPTLYPDTDKRVRSSACLPVNAMVAIYYYNFLIRGVFCTPASESKKNNNKWPASVGVWVQNTSQINAIGAIVKPQCARWCAMCDVLAESWCAVRPTVKLHILPLTWHFPKIVSPL